MDTRERVDLLIEDAFDEWSSLPEVERCFAGWTPDHQATYLESWPLEERVLERLASFEQRGAMSPEQQVRWRSLKAVVAAQRPIVERLHRRYRNTGAPPAADSEPAPASARAAS